MHLLDLTCSCLDELVLVAFSLITVSAPWLLDSLVKRYVGSHLKLFIDVSVFGLSGCWSLATHVELVH
jgi:hypothetical protein